MWPGLRRRLMVGLGCFADPDGHCSRSAIARVAIERQLGDSQRIPPTGVAPPAWWSDDGAQPEANYPRPRTVVLLLSPDGATRRSKPGPTYPQPHPQVGELQEGLSGSQALAVPARGGSTGPVRSHPKWFPGPRLARPRRVAFVRAKGRCASDRSPRRASESPDRQRRTPHRLLAAAARPKPEAPQAFLRLAALAQW